MEHEASFGSLGQRLLEQLLIGPIGRCFHDELRGRFGMLSMAVWHRVTQQREGSSILRNQPINQFTFLVFVMTCSPECFLQMSLSDLLHVLSTCLFVSRSVCIAVTDFRMRLDAARTAAAL